MKRKGILFKELSPRNETIITFSCNLCDRNFKAKKSLYRHLRVNHGGADRPEDLPDELPDLIRCMMCKFQISRGEIKRHLRKVHYIPDCRPGYVLKGWDSHDNGESWDPLFASRLDIIEVSEQAEGEVAVEEVIEHPRESLEAGS